MTRRRKPDDPIDIVLPIPSFLDMAFQIFAFFIVTFKPAALEGQLEMAMPASGEARAQTQEQADPTVVPDKDLELKTELTVIVKANQSLGNGTIGSIQVKGVEGAATDVGLAESDHELNGLRRFLERSQQGLGKNKDSIKIEAESSLKYAFIVRVMDACARAGFRNIGFAPPPDYTASN